MERKSGRTLETCIVEKTPRKQEGTGGHLREVNVTLDIDTANPLLLLSEDLKSVRRWNRMQYWPDNAKRFDIVSCVLGCEGFTSGRHSWEVEVEVEKEQVVGGLGWAVGVARESVRRKGLVYACPREGIWVVGKVMPYGFLAFTSPEDSISILSHEPKKIRVSLDYKEGRVEFFDAHTGDLIFSFPSTSFSGERLHPYFRMEWLGQLKCCWTANGHLRSRRPSPDISSSELQGCPSRFVPCGRTPQAPSPTPCAVLLCGTHLPTFTKCSENRNPESPNDSESLQHSGSVWHGQSIPHSEGCVGVKPTAQVRTAEERQDSKEEAGEMSPLKMKNTSSGVNAEPRRAEEEEDVGVTAVRELHLQNHDVPSLDLEGSSGKNWERMLIQDDTSHKEKGRGVSPKEEKDIWLSSEDYMLFALIPFLLVLIVTVYDLLS
ncbi:uncharacterized protein LOC125428774 isoform X1 [Sphaerodactylus townsendi]|uniref:uncharacterized protein LOC125428774 isoform X1 n=1 Tax=Sphaerodactylus townsendi TaxID=933632 RepID=UPI002025BDC2|nr:uncharacterized protein LOC125428774 isoform X1 [Sphaerodactylus townsendi]